MSWARCGTIKDRRTGRNREIGYAVDARCDRPNCRARINRGLSYVCGDMHGGGEHGCGGYFCSSHLYMGKGEQLCQECWDAAPGGDSAMNYLSVEHGRRVQA